MTDDYTDLVERLKSYADTADDMVYGICVNAPETMKIAAAAIEKLVKDRNVLQLQNHLERCEHEHTRKERDAAVADLKEYRDCDVCKNNNDECLNNGLCKKCSVGKSTRNYWEWRGVQEASK